MSTKKLQLIGSLGTKIYSQNEEPTDAQDGALWIDLDEEALGASSNAVLYTAQSLTDEQKAQARENIGAEGKSMIDTFLDNTDVDYAFDENTGAYYTVIRVYKQKLDGSYQYPFVYAPNGVNAGDKSTYDMVKDQSWLLAINGGVFNVSTLKPDGIVIQNGVVIKNSATNTHNQCKPLTIDSNGNLSFAEYNADADELASSGIVSAVCGFMPIIVDYEAVPQTEWNAVSHYTENAQRQIIGQWGNGDYAIITCEGRSYHNSDGWTIAEAQAVCKKHGLKFAYNLDGGGSTETMLGMKHINTIYEGATGRIVPTFLVFNGSDRADIEAPNFFDEIDSIYVPLGAYIKTAIPETELYTAEYKAKNDMLVHRLENSASSGHIMSSTNTYTPFIKMHPWTFADESYAEYYDKTALVVKTNGVETHTEPSMVLEGIDKTLPHTVKGELNETVVDCYVDGEFKFSNAVGTTKSANNYYYLFAYGGNPTATRYQFTGSFYYLKLWDAAGNLKYHFVAARRCDDGVYGVYDKVNDTFYVSDTTVAFTE